MLNGKKIVVVMPAYNAAKTLEQTCREVPKEFVDQVILVDDGSKDSTARLALDLGLVTFVHRKNLGYGRNQKTYRDDFAFANQMLAQVICFGFRIGEVSCPTRYFAEASSINFWSSVKYGFGVLATSLMFRLQKMRLAKFRIFDREGGRLVPNYYQLVEK